MLSNEQACVVYKNHYRIEPRQGRKLTRDTLREFSKKLYCEDRPISLQKPYYAQSKKHHATLKPMHMMG